MDSEDQFAPASGLLFEQAMAQTRMAVCLSDPRQDDNPIIFANKAFRALTGYDEDEILGQNCRFLQGERTDEKTLDRIREAIRTEGVLITELINYRKDGTPFWNALHLGPIYDDEGELLYFFGSQWDVTELHTARADERHARILARELSHRIKNIFSVISSIVTLTGRAEGQMGMAKLLNGRIRSLALAHERAFVSADGGGADLRELAEAVVSPYDPDGDRVRFDGESVYLPAQSMSLFSLILHELATNAFQNGALGEDAGTVAVTWTRDHPFIALEWQEHRQSAGALRTSDEGLDYTLIRRLLGTLGGELSTSHTDTGFNVQLTLKERP